MKTYLDYLIEKEKQEKVLNLLKVEKSNFNTSLKSVRNSNDYILFMIDYQKVFFKLFFLKKLAKNEFKEFNEND